MLKKDTLGTASKKSLGEAFKCGECLHFRQHPHTSHQTVCFKEGVRSFSPAPSCFTPDITQVATNSDQLVQLAALFAGYNVKQRRILLAMLRSKDSAKKKLTFGTKVYFLSFGKDYISNYLSGYVWGYTSTNELMIGGSPDPKSRGKSYCMYCKDDSHLMNQAEWKVKRLALRQAGKVQDPTVKFKPKSAVADYEPPTLDNAPASWHDKKEISRRKTTSELTFVVS